MGHRVGVRRRRRPRRPRASTTAGSWPSPSASCGPAPTATGCSTASRCSTRARRSSTSPSSSAATSRCTRARSSQGNTVVGDGCEIGPDTRLVDCVVGSGARRRSTPSAVDAEIGDGAAVGPFAHLPPGLGRRKRTPTPAPFYTGAATDGRLSRREHDGAADVTEMEKVTTKKLALYSGRTHPELAAEVAEPPRHRARPGPNIVEFANGEIRPRFAESVRGSDVFIMQSHYGIDGHSVNDSIMEQLIMIDAAYRASAKRITAVCPFYGYARQDRKAEGREPITARLVADMFKAAGAKRMISIDLHAGQIQGFFDGPVDHLTAMPVLEDYLRRARHEPGDRVARRRADQGRRADGPAPRRLRRRPGVLLQAPAEGHDQRGRGHRGDRRRRRPAVHAHRRHDRHRRHDHVGRRAADRARRHRGVGDGDPRRAVRRRRSTG